MISYKFLLDNNETDILKKYSLEFQWALRFAYNIYKNSNKDLLSNKISKDQYKLITKQANICKQIKDSGYVKYIDVSLIQMAVNEAKNKRKELKVIFGDSAAFYKLKKGDKSQETKQKWKDSRIYGMFMQGSCSDRGNRKARLDIDNNCIYVWVDYKNKVKFDLKLSEQRRKVLKNIQEQCKNKKSYFNVRINKDSIDISFPLSYLHVKKEYKYVKNRVLAIDSNPDELGFVIYDEQTNKILYKNIIDVRDINNIKGKNKISTNKRHFEKFNIGKMIVNLAKSYHCEYIVTEDLSIKSKDHSKGIRFNRQVNNTWNRGIYSQTLKKWSSIYGIKLIEVYTGYSSLVGCLKNPDEYDSIAAAIEIAKRGIKEVDNPTFINWKNVDLDDLNLPQSVINNIVASAMIHGITNVGELMKFLREKKIEFRNRMQRTKRNKQIIKSPKSLVYFRI